MRVLTISFIAAVLASSCGSSKQATSQDAVEPVKVEETATGIANSNMLPKAIIYKTNGDYADYVPVTLNSTHNALVSFPAPGDLRSSEPLALADGFLLDRRGISPNTAFTRWTYAEYSALPTTPSPAEIMANIIPDVRVTAIYRMPFEASDPDVVKLCNEAIGSGLKNCTPILSPLTLSLD